MVQIVYVGTQGSKATHVKAGIIAAGEGSRLKAEGMGGPKPLVPVNGVPLIERLIRSFRRNGIEEVVTIVNEYSLSVKEFVESRNFGIPVRFVVKTTESSMHSLFELSPHLREGPFLLSTVDSVFSEREFAAFLASAASRPGADAVLAVTEFIDDENPLYVRLDESGRIVSFGEPGPAPMVTGGLYVFSPAVFGEIGTVRSLGISRLRNFLGHLLGTGYRLEGFSFSKIVDVDHVRDIGTAERLLGTA